MRNKTIAAVATAAALLVAGCSAPDNAAETVPAAPAAETVTAPCPTEDYAGPLACYWDASERGNGIGRSFTWTGSQVIYSDSK